MRAADTDALGVRIRPPTQANVTSPARATRNVLVVDDVPEICALFRDVGRRLRSEDVRVTTETNSARGLDLARAETFDVVVTDFRMREVDGIEVLRAARAKHPQGVRILMTGYGEIPATIERIREAGIDAYVKKPLQAADLLALLRGFLDADPGHVAQHRARAREVESAAAREREGVPATRA